MMCNTQHVLLGVALVLAGGVFAGEAQDVAQKPDGPFSVAVDEAKGTFSVRAWPSGKTFIAEGKLSGTGGTRKAAPAKDRIFGNGDALEVSYPNGNRDTFLVFRNLPFVLFRASLHNGGAEPTRIKDVRLFSAGIELGKKPAELRALGTGGLTAPDKNPGSYAWLAVADPQTRNGVVAGWLTHDRGSGVVFSSVESERVRIEARIDYGRLRIAPGNDADTETLAIGYFDDARLGLEAWADAVARVYSIKLRPQPAGYCTWYSSPHGGASDEKHLAEQSDFAAKNLAPFGFSVMQIDDGWQEGTGGGNGPRKVFGSFNAKGPYPGGMKATADDIKKHGLTPGIWFMPFAGTHNDPFFKEHQDWFVKTEDGKPYDTAWGGTCLDMTHAGAREYLRGVVRKISREWGYTYFKMDGMWTGSATRQIYVNSGYKEDGIGDAVFSNPDKTNIEAYRDGITLVRETAGAGVFILGCCAPQNMRSFGGAFGLVDAMRVGPDNGAEWGGLLAGPLFSSRNYHLHGRIWYNDPDPVYVRANVPLEHARAICSWVTISGDLNLSSEWFFGLPAERVDILRRTMPSHGLLPRPVDLFENEPARMWLLTDTRRSPRRDVVALYNWTSKPLDFDCPLERLGLAGDTAYVAFDYWANAFLPPFKGSLRAALPKESCQVLAVRPVQDRPQLLSTSRHITQGIVDVLEEKWDDASKTLSGTSKLVAGDPYELRIAAFAPGKAWSIESAEVSAEDKAAGARIASTETNGCVRVTIECPASRDAAWSVRFRPGAVAARPQAAARLKAEAEPFRPVSLSWERTDGVTYEVAREGGKTAVTSAASWMDADTEPEKTYTYTVTAVDLAGNRSEPAKATVTTPALPKLPPVPHVHLSDLKPATATVGWGQAGVDKSIEGKPLTVNGKKYAKGMGVHAPSELLYACKPEYKRFVAVVGLDDEKRDDERPSVVFEVHADDKLLAQSPKLTWRTNRCWHFDVPLPAVTKRVRLVVTDAGDGIAADHADWVDAGFVTR
ncbi:MAG: NPCBM/NEW2 domain-containing protein [Planctomycetota bacterium]|nr:NPCBM/NEW2 domain-containing protein [Planctomycetota bacterium]